MKATEFKRPLRKIITELTIQEVMAITKPNNFLGANQRGV